MNRRNILNLSTVAAMGLVSAVVMTSLSGAAQAQTAKDLVGTWILVSTDNTDAKGAKIEPFGPHPLGSYTFDASGHFTQAIVPGEKGSATGIVAAFGDYSVTNGGKTLVRHMVGSQDPGAIGKDLSIEITLSNDEMRTGNANPTTGAGHANSVWKRAK